MTTQELNAAKSKKFLMDLVKSNSVDLLKGTLPKVLKYRFLNMGFNEVIAKGLVDQCVKQANQFSHYKIGGKYCKENKHQNY
jgi:hypothetical protein